MKRIFNITLRAAAVVLTVALAAGCVFEKENPTLVRGTQKVMVELNVGADDMATKATADSEKDIEDLRIYAFIGNVMVGYANPQSLSGAWYMDLNLPETGTYDIDFWAVANVDGLSGNSITISPNMSKDQLKSIVYNATIVNSDYSDTGFPMYAIHTEQDVDVAAVVKDAGKDAANTSPGHEGHFILNKTVTLNLTRSLSKITVYAAEEGSTTASGIKISGVTVKNVPKTSNLFVKTSTLSAEGLDASAQTALNNPTAGEVAVTGLTNSTNYSNAENYTEVTLPYYIAENPNGNDWSQSFNCTTQVQNATVLEVSYLLPGDSNTNTRTGTVYLPKIERNIHYKVFCRIRANGKAEIKVVAVSWDFNEEEISFEDIVSMTGNPNWGEGSIATTTYQFGLAADQTATCTFNLQTPKNGTWYATIEGKDIQDFAFVDKNDQDEEEVVLSKTVSGAIGVDDDMKFTIKTLTKLGLGDSRTVNIRLVAKGVDGRTYNVKIGNADYFTINQL